MKPTLHNFIFTVNGHAINVLINMDTNKDLPIEIADSRHGDVIAESNVVIRIDEEIVFTVYPRNPDLGKNMLGMEVWNLDEHLIHDDPGHAWHTKEADVNEAQKPASTPYPYVHDNPYIGWGGSK